MKKKNWKRFACLVCLIMTVVFVSKSTELIQAQTPVEDKVGVLITGWGMPAGYNFHYSWTSSDYPRVGDIADNDTVPCKIGHSEGPDGMTIHVGIIPWALHSGIFPPCDAVSLGGGNVWEKFYDYSGIYWWDMASLQFLSIDPGAPPVAPGDIPAGVPTVALKDVVYMNSELTYEVDPRDGTDYVAGWYRIGDWSNPFQNGISDLTEGGPAYYMRYIGYLGGPSTLPEAYLPPPEEQGLSHEVETLLYNDFGDRIDIRHGAYTETKCDNATGCEDINGNPVGDGGTIFPLHDDVAEQFAGEGFRKMLLTRETTDYNKYALETMTGNYIKERLCEIDVLDDTEINFSRQVGRTPEFNAMCVQNMQPYLEQYPQGTTVALVYVTRGLPWEITNGTDCIGNQYPFCQDIYFENAYLNYLSWKEAVKKAYGDQYNLIFTTDSSDNDTLSKNLYTFSLETADLMGVEGEQVFLTTRDGIQLAKAQGIDKIVVVPVHWNYDNLDTIMRSKEENWLPIAPKADVAAGNFAVTHCETSACDLTTDTGAADCFRNSGYLERNYDHIVDCSDPAAVAEITFMPSFSNMYEKFAVSYYVVLRGALERFGLYPAGVDASEVGSPDIEASQLLTKLAGGTVAVSDISSPVDGSSITVPGDPYPLYPENFTCDGGVDAESPHPPEREDTYDCLWEDTVITVGHLALPPSMTDVTAAGPAVYFGPYRNFFNRDVTITIPYDVETAQCQVVKPYIYNHLTRAWDELKAESYGNGSLTFKTQVLGLFRTGISNLTSLSSISGKVFGDIQEGVTVEVYTLSCGGDILVGEFETDSAGNYSSSDLEAGRYLLVATASGYNFVPVAEWVDIPQTESQCYDFTSISD